MKKLNVPRALLFGAIAFLLMTIFWRAIGSLLSTQTAFEAWSFHTARKIVTIGFTAIAFVGGLKCE
jgi:hypothetical protein